MGTLKKLLKQYIDQSGLTYNAFETKNDISIGLVKRIMTNDDYYPTLENTIKIADELGQPLDFLLDRHKYLNSFVEFKSHKYLPDIAITIIEYINQFIKKHEIKDLNSYTFIYLFKEIYVYTLNNDNKFDEKFTHWFLTDKLIKSKDY